MVCIFALIDMDSYLTLYFTKARKEKYDQKAFALHLGS